ncbi:hypothetical protein IV102_13790 [bacterium]|nr:hypothetical protein [bacterium]
MDELLAQARFCAERGQLARGAEICAAGLKEHGPQVGLLEALADYLTRLGFKHAAVEKLYQLHTLQPDRVDVQGRLARLALEAGRPDVAAPLIGDFPATLQALADSHAPTLRFGYAYLLYFRLRYREAAAEFRKLLSTEDWAIWSHSMAGLCHYRQGELEPALRHFEQGLKRLNHANLFEYRELYFNKACVLYVHGHLLATLTSLQRLYAIDPAYPQVGEWITEVKIRLRGGDDGPRQGASARPRPRPPSLVFAHTTPFELRRLRRQRGH